MAVPARRRSRMARRRSPLRQSFGSASYRMSPSHLATCNRLPVGLLYLRVAAFDTAHVARGAQHESVNAFNPAKNQRSRTMKTGDFLTDKEAKAALKLYRSSKPGTFAARCAAEIIAPVIGRINAKLGQQNDPRYLAYAVEYA